MIKEPLTIQYYAVLRIRGLLEKKIWWNSILYQRPTPTRLAEALVYLDGYKPPSLKGDRGGERERKRESLRRVK